MNAVRVAARHVDPIKSCAGIALQEMRFDAQGPLDDRRWMRVLAPQMPSLQLSGRGGERLRADPPAG